MRTIAFLVAWAGICCIGCDDSPNCTLEFVTVGVVVTGGPLTEYFTLRNATGDTMTTSTPADSNWYPILDDGFQFFLSETQETFQFRGVINDSLVIDEEYVIGADKCHVMRQSGKTQIDL